MRLALIGRLQAYAAGMPPITVNTDSSWTDPIAVGTLALAALTAAALVYTVWSAKTDRAAAQADRADAQADRAAAQEDRADAKQQLQKEREQRKKDLLRQERVPQLMEASKLYARWSATSGAERGEVESRLRAVLWILPDGMANRLKWQFKVPLLPEDEAKLAEKAGVDRLPESHRFTEGEVFNELLSNNRWAIAGGNPNVSANGGGGA